MIFGPFLAYHMDMIHRKSSICLFLAALAAVFLLICLHTSESYGAEEKIALYCVRETNHEWEIHATEPLWSFTGGRVVALLLTLQISDGWHVDEATCPDGCTVTVHEKQGGHVTVLLDGILPDCGSLLFCVVLRSSGGEVPADVRVAEGAVLYIRSEGGEVESRELFASCHASEHETSPSITIETETMPEDVSETVTEAEPVTNRPGEDESEHVSEQEVPLPPAGEPACYVGCRESAVKDGLFAVQLLFEEGKGSSASTPAVWATGGGHLTLISETAEVSGERLYAMTYRGLSADRVYVFSVYTSDGIVEVVYRNGRFTEHRGPQL